MLKRINYIQIDDLIEKYVKLKWINKNLIQPAWIPFSKHIVKEALQILQLPCLGRNLSH